MLRVLLAILVSSLALAGCGGQADPPSPDDETSITDLLAYFEPDAVTIRAADAVAARSELDLPEDAEATDLFAVSELDPGDPLLDLTQAVAPALPGRHEFAETFEVPEVLEAIDGTRIRAAATNGEGDHEVAVIATDQPFDEIAAALDRTYTRDGRTLRATDPEIQISRLDDLGEGLILLTARRADAGELIANPPGGPREAAAMTDPGSGPALTLLRLGGARGCLLAAAITERADRTAGQLAIRVDGEASADAVNEDAASEVETELDLGSVSAEGDVVTIPYTATEGGRTSGGQALYGQLILAGLYDCAT